MRVGDRRAAAAQSHRHDQAGVRAGGERDRADDGADLVAGRLGDGEDGVDPAGQVGLAVGAAGRGTAKYVPSARSVPRGDANSDDSPGR
ncbi:hypothetical protein [Paractinoplanes durhamensis]|uniref:hypothetical protein n=1 Tax=Paractinoplanes durhamensis TaxID=113563 RepID=UPI0036301E13